MDNVLEYFSSPSVQPVIAALAAALASIVIASAAISFRTAIQRTTRLRYSHKIAVLGYPRSGKTTLIATLFFRILSGSLARKIRVSGQETIDRITKYNELIRSGKNLGPSTDKDVFSYRFQYDVPFRSIYQRLLFGAHRGFDVELADFPGEYSEEITSEPVETPSESGTVKKNIAPKSSSALIVRKRKRPRKVTPSGRLYSLQYHSWISQADKYLILIDIADILESGGRAAEVRSRIFSAVLYLKESSVEDSRALSEKPAALVFTKADLLGLTEVPTDFNVVNYRTVNENTFSPELFSKRSDAIKRGFEETITMMANNFSSVTVVFHSSYAQFGPLQAAEKILINFIVPDGHLALRSLGEVPTESDDRQMRAVG